jgi:hypothetical protein
MKISRAPEEILLRCNGEKPGKTQTKPTTNQAQSQPNTTTRFHGPRNNCISTQKKKKKKKKK